MRLAAFEFIRRFLQHVLPTGFMKVRYFGFLSPSFAMPRDELIGQTIDIFHPGVADTSERSDYLARLRAEGSFRGETLHRRKDGSIYPVMYSTSIVSLGDRELVLGIDRDITDIKRSQEQLQEQRRSLHMIISSMPNLLVKVDESANTRLRFARDAITAVMDDKDKE